VFIITTSAKGRRLCFYLCLSVCLSVCLSARLLKVDEIFRVVGRNPGNKRLDFGDDLGHNPVPGIFKAFFTTYIAIPVDSQE